MGPAPYGVMPQAAAQVGPVGGAMSAEQQINALKDQAGYFEETLDSIRKRIEELQANNKG